MQYRLLRASCLSRRVPSALSAVRYTNAWCFLGLSAQGKYNNKRTAAGKWSCKRGRELAAGRSGPGPGVFRSGDPRERPLGIPGLACHPPCRRGVSTSARNLHIGAQIHCRGPGSKRACGFFSLRVDAPQPGRAFESRRGMRNAAPALGGLPVLPWDLRTWLLLVVDSTVHVH